MGWKGWKGWKTGCVISCLLYSSNIAHIHVYVVLGKRKKKRRDKTKKPIQYKGNLTKMNRMSRNTMSRDQTIILGR